MANYKQATVSGESWTRCDRVVCNNPLNGEKSIVFQEETIAYIGDNLVNLGNDHVYTSLDEETINTKFNIINPETGDVLGESTCGEVYALLHSLYMHLALERDNKQNEEEEQ